MTIGPIESGEIKALRFDFSKEAAEITSLSTTAVTCVVIDGTDPTPASVLVGSATIDGKEVVQIVQSGVVGCTYKVRVYATDSSGLRHGMSTHFKVVNG